MKHLTLPLACMSLALAGCHLVSPPSGGSFSSSSASSSSVQAVGDMRTWQTYESKTFGVTLRYPEGWEIRNASKEEAAFSIIAWGYTAEAAKTLRECEAKWKPAQRNLNCGQAHADSAFGIYNEGFIDYQKLEPHLKENYPYYHLLPWKGMQGFEYEGRTSPPSHSYQINHPNGEDGVSVTVWAKDKPLQELIRTVVSTITFSAK